MPDLVLGMFGGYPAQAALPFVRSLRRAGSAAEVVLLLHGNPPGTEAALRELGVAPMEVDLPGVPETVSYNVARYARFLEFLSARRSLGRVLVSDVRDVVFQLDPFSVLLEPGVHLFAEHPSKPVGACIWTQAWVRYRYGDDALPPIANRPVICSGIALGAAPSMRDYLERVTAELTPPLRSTHYMAGYDQGVVNRLVHTGRLDGLVTVHGWQDTPVLHLGNAPAGSLRLDERGRALNDRGDVAAIVHQWDRHPGLPERLRALREGP